jgi:hypothetical protein
LHRDLAATGVQVAGGEHLADAAKGDADLGRHALVILETTAAWSHQGRNCG